MFRITEDSDCALDSTRTGTSPCGRAHCIPKWDAARRSLHEAAHWLRERGEGAPGVQIEEKHLRTETVLQVLEHSSRLSPQENGILSIEIRPLHLRLRRRRHLLHRSLRGRHDSGWEGQKQDEVCQGRTVVKVRHQGPRQTALLPGHVHCPEPGGKGDLDGATHIHSETPGMNDSKPVKTPVDPGHRLVKANKALDQPLYQSVVGSLMYLATCTRPDIAYAVGMLARFSSKPNQSHWTAAKRVLRYLRGTVNFGILYRGESGVLGYSDADWAGDADDRKSTSGYMFLIAGGPVSWKSRKQSTVALSTAEAEYVALSTAVQECMWMQRLLSELGNPPDGPTTILEDNQSSIAMAKNPQFHGRAKHIDIKHHFIRDQVSIGSIELQYCPTNEMLADVLTKGLAHEKFSILRERAGVVPQESIARTELS